MKGYLLTQSRIFTEGDEKLGEGHEGEGGFGNSGQGCRFEPLKHQRDFFILQPGLVQFPLHQIGRQVLLKNRLAHGRGGQRTDEGEKFRGRGRELRPIYDLWKLDEEISQSQRRGSSPFGDAFVQGRAGEGVVSEALRGAMIRQ